MMRGGVMRILTATIDTGNHIDRQVGYLDEYTTIKLNVRVHWSEVQWQYLCYVVIINCSD